MSLNISSYGLLILKAGIECAMHPHLYPTTDFTDTGIQEHDQHTYADNANRVISIGTSWTRKCLSSVRMYAEQRSLAFFLYEKYLGMNFFNAHKAGQDKGLTGDVLARACGDSTGRYGSAPTPTSSSPSRRQSGSSRCIRLSLTAGSTCGVPGTLGSSLTYRL